MSDLSPVPLTDQQRELRLRRITLWTVGYRRLMAGGLHESVHTAGTAESLLDPVTDTYADLRVSDVEWLLADRDRLEREVERLTAVIEAAKAIKPRQPTESAFGHAFGLGFNDCRTQVRAALGEETR